MNVNCQLQGAIIIHIDDFNLAGTVEFVEKVIAHVEQELTVSKIEEDVFRFTDLVIKVVEDGMKSQWTTTLRVSRTSKRSGRWKIGTKNYLNSR